MNDSQKLLEYVKTNRVSLSAMIQEYQRDPVGLRNAVAEQGVELTPDQIKKIVELVLEVGNFCEFP